MNEKLRHKIMKFLSRADVVATYRHALLQRGENSADSRSCEWIFESPAYNQWRDPRDPSHALWMFSGPGTGKTVLAAHIVRRLREEFAQDGSAVLYFFCNGLNAHRDDSLAILRTLLCQLLDLLSTIPDWVVDFYNDCYRRGLELAQSLTFVILQDLFCKTLELFRNVQIIIDGIDEVDIVDRKPLLEFLSSIGRRGANDAINVLFASRRESDISHALRNFVRLPIHPSDTRADIEDFIAKSIATKLDVTREQEETISSILLKKARGMFIWVRLVIDLLKDAATADEIREILSSIPNELHDIYCVILDKLQSRLSTGPASRLQRAQSIFKWLALSYRPLQVVEIQEALAVEAYEEPQGDQKKSWDRHMQKFRPTAQAVLDVCGNLIDETDGAISLLHHTFREFLLSASGGRSQAVQKFNVYANTGNANMTESCLVYLYNVEGVVQHQLSKVHENDKVIRGRAQAAILSELPFYDYACRQWPFHLGRCPTEHNASILHYFPYFMLCSSWYQGWSLFSPTGRVPNSRLFRRIRKHGKLISIWLDLLDVMLGGFVSQNTVSLKEIAEYTTDAPMLLRERFNDRATDEIPVMEFMDLALAAERGHYAMVRWILKQSSPDYEKTAAALLAASQGHHEETLWILCSYMVSTMQSPSALHFAKVNGDAWVESILLNHIQVLEESIAHFQRTGLVSKSIASRALDIRDKHREGSALPQSSGRMEFREKNPLFTKYQPFLTNDQPFWQHKPLWTDGGDHFAATGDYPLLPSKHHYSPPFQPPTTRYDPYEHEAFQLPGANACGYEIPARPLRRARARQQLRISYPCVNTIMQDVTEEILEGIDDAISMTTEATTDDEVLENTDDEVEEHRQEHRRRHSY